MQSRTHFQFSDWLTCEIGMWQDPNAQKVQKNADFNRSALILLEKLYTCDQDLLQSNYIKDVCMFCFVLLKSAFFLTLV